MRGEVIYADHNATTPLLPAVVERMQTAFKVWGNPSSVHALGRKAHEFMEESREWVAKAVGRHPQEVVFTSGGSEANTLAVRGFERVLTTRIEHSSVVDSLRERAQFIEVDRQGQVDLNRLEAQLDSYQPELVSVMTANNETGAVLPIREIAELCERKKILFHTDAVQALGKISVEHFQIAPLITLSAHKIGGPKGVGALIIKKGVQLSATHFGGAQEIKRRGGTQNTIGIAGFGAACRELKMLTSERRDRFDQALLSRLENVQIHCYGNARVPNTSLVRFPGIGSDVLLSALDLAGVQASAGSACSSGSINPSRVLLGMGFPAIEAKEAVRFSWGPDSDVDTAANIVVEQVQRILARRKTC